MAKITFLPSDVSIEVETNTKILVAAKKAKVDIRFGCANCRCGTCAVEVDDGGKFAPMEDDEKALLAKMKLPTKGKIRLSCRGKIQADQSAQVDLSFQLKYDPDAS